MKSRVSEGGSGVGSHSVWIGIGLRTQQYGSARSFSGTRWCKNPEALRSWLHGSRFCLLQVEPSDQGTKRRFSFEYSRGAMTFACLAGLHSIWTITLTRAYFQEASFTVGSLNSDCCAFDWPARASRNFHSISISISLCR